MFATDPLLQQLIHLLKIKYIGYCYNAFPPCDCRCRWVDDRLAVVDPAGHLHLYLITERENSLTYKSAQIYSRDALVHCLGKVNNYVVEEI